MEFNADFGKTIQDLAETDHVDPCAAVAKAVLSAGRHLPEKRRKKPWIDHCAPTIMTAIKERNEAARAFAANPSPLRKWRRKITGKQVRLLVTDGQARWYSKLLERLENCVKSPRDAYVALDQILRGTNDHHRTPPIGTMQFRDGSKATTAAEKNECWEEQFKTPTFQRESEVDDEAVRSVRQRPTAMVLGDPPDFEEFAKALRRMKANKAPGSNGVQVEFYQSLSRENLMYVHEKIFCRFWNDPDFEPEDWKTVDLRPIYKGKGSKTEAKNYRPIALLDTLSKVMSSIIATRLGNHLDEVGLEEQAGFMKARGCSDAATALKCALQKLKAANRHAFVLFVDLVKAFDSVNRTMLWTLLAKFGLPKTLIDVIKKLYKDVVISISTDGEVISFDSLSGVKQGDNLAPVLFLFVIQAVADRIDQTWDNTVEKPIFASSKRWRLTQREDAKKCLTEFSFSRLFYADDGSMIFTSRKDLILGTRTTLERRMRPEHDTLPRPC